MRDLIEIGLSIYFSVLGQMLPKRDNRMAKFPKREDHPYGAAQHPQGGITFAPLGYCLYCGSRDRLTDEHIVPYGLNGNLVLPKSSCPDCQKITSDIERQILRGLFGDIRVRHNLASRHRKRRGNPVREIEIIESSDEEKIQLKSENLPTAITLPHWGTDHLYWFPGLIAPKKNDKLIYINPASEIENLLKITSNRAFSMPNLNINPSLFARFIAKIAISFTYAVFSGCPVGSKLGSIVVGGGDFRPYIGSELNKPEGGYLWSLSQALVDLPNGSRWLGVKVEFFTCFETPSYLVLVGDDHERSIMPSQLASYARGLEVKLI